MMTLFCGLRFSQSGDHHHGLECFRFQGLRKWYWNLDDKLKCEKEVAFVQKKQPDRSMRVHGHGPKTRGPGRMLNMAA